MFNMMSTMVPFMTMGVFVLVIIVFITIIATNMKRNSYNNRQPRITTDAKIISKRTHVRGNDHYYTDYFITFEFESGDRSEMQVGEDQYGILVEGDDGKLSFQGRRFLSYLRAI